jgi:hypothetical protein
LGDILEFHNARCSLCGHAVDAARSTRFSANDLRNGWGCSCRRRKLALVADEVLPILNSVMALHQEAPSGSTVSRELDE